jgi:hypothetical protein
VRRASNVALVRVVAAATLVGTALAGVTLDATAAVASGPHIVARPNNLMVNTNTTLTGTGFPVKAKLMIGECAKTSWIAPQNPSVNRNRITVVTDSRGHYVHQFRVTLCGGKRGPTPTSQIRYIGEPHPEGVDRVRLVGPARVVVTFP